MQTRTFANKELREIMRYIDVDISSYLVLTEFSVQIPIIPCIDSAILEAVSREGCQLDMSAWHTCETTHCRAGWAVALAGPDGKALEQAWGTVVAAALIYKASRWGKRVPDFYANDEDTMADIKACAAEEAEGGERG